jgi:hypothetical protein
VKFLIDNNLSPLLADALKAAGHDAIHLRDLGMQAATDHVVLEHARADGRILVPAPASRPAWTRAMTCASSFSVAASRSSRLRARSAASTGLRQATSRSPGQRSSMAAVCRPGEAFVIA